MPSRENTATQCLPPSISARLAVEAGVSQGGIATSVIAATCCASIASAPDNLLLREYGFTVENVCKRAVAVVR